MSVNLQTLKVVVVNLLKKPSELRWSETLTINSLPSLRNKMKSVKQSVNVAVTSSGWYKGLPQKCEAKIPFHRWVSEDSVIVVK